MIIQEFDDSLTLVVPIWTSSCNGVDHESELVRAKRRG